MTGHPFLRRFGRRWARSVISRAALSRIRISPRSQRATLFGATPTTSASSTWVSLSRLRRATTSSPVMPATIRYVREGGYICTHVAPPGTNVLLPHWLPGQIAGLAQVRDVARRHAQHPPYLLVGQEIVIMSCRRDDRGRDKTRD